MQRQKQSTQPSNTKSSARSETTDTSQQQWSRENESLPPLTESGSPNPGGQRSAPAQSQSYAPLEDEEGRLDGAVQTPLPVMTEGFRHAVSKQDYYVNPGLYAEGATQEVRPPHADAYWLKPSEAKAYGINSETHVHCWARNPQLDHITHYDNGDRIAELMRQNPGFEPVFIPGTKRLIENGELVLCKKPWTPEQQAEHERRTLYEAYLYADKIYENRGEFKDPLGQVTNLHRANKMTEQEQRELANFNTQVHRQQGIIGQTNHLNWYEEMQKPDGFDRIRQTEDRFRGVRMNELSRDQRELLEAWVEMKEEKRLAGEDTRVKLEDVPQRRRSAPAESATRSENKSKPFTVGFGKSASQVLRERGHR